MAPNRRQLVGTFADLITSGHELTVNCESCQHRAPVNVPALDRQRALVTRTKMHEAV